MRGGCASGALLLALVARADLVVQSGLDHGESCLSRVEVFDQPDNCWDGEVHGHRVGLDEANITPSLRNCTDAGEHQQPLLFALPPAGRAGEIRPATKKGLCLEFQDCRHLRFRNCTDVSRWSTFTLVQSAAGGQLIELIVDGAPVCVCPDGPPSSPCPHLGENRRMLHIQSAKCSNQVSDRSPAAPQRFLAATQEAAVVLTLLVQNMDYSKLHEDSQAMASFKKAVQDGIVFTQSGRLKAEEITVDVVEGQDSTVKVRCTVIVASRTLASDLQLQLQSSSILGATINNHISALENIAELASGRTRVMLHSCSMILDVDAAQTSVDDPFDCSGNQADWSEAKRKWCCDNRGKACEEDVTDAGPQEDAVFAFTVKGIDYEKLMADKKLSGSFIAYLKHSIATVAAHGCKPEGVDMQLSQGSVFAQGTVEVPDGKTTAALQSNLDAARLEDVVEADLKNLPGIEEVTVGSISVEQRQDLSGGSSFPKWLWFVGVPLLVICNCALLLWLGGIVPNYLRPKSGERTMLLGGGDLNQFMDAIVVPGGGLTKDGFSSPWVIERLQRAKALKDQVRKRPNSKLPYIIALNASRRPLSSQEKEQMQDRGYDVFEAEVNSRYLIYELGVPADQVLKEELSLDTVGNAYFLRTQHTDMSGLQNITVITNEFHMERTKAIFSKVFSLLPLPDGMRGGYQVSFEKVPDTGVRPEALDARREAEREALARFQRAATQWKTLTDLHNYLFKRHRAYTQQGSMLANNNGADSSRNDQYSSRTDSTYQTAGHMVSFSAVPTYDAP